jgi:hypothetical protein
MTDIRVFFLFMGLNIVMSAIFTGMFMNVVGTVLAVGGAFCLAGASMGDYS